METLRRSLPEAEHALKAALNQVDKAFAQAEIERQRAESALREKAQAQREAFEAACARDAASEALDLAIKELNKTEIANRVADFRDAMAREFRAEDRVQALELARVGHEHDMIRLREQAAFEQQRASEMARLDHEHEQRIAKLRLYGALAGAAVAAVSATVSVLATLDSRALKAELVQERAARHSAEFDLQRERAKGKVFAEQFEAALKQLRAGSSENTSAPHSRNSSGPDHSR